MAIGTFFRVNRTEHMTTVKTPLYATIHCGNEDIREKASAERKTKAIIDAPETLHPHDLPRPRFRIRS